MTGKTHACAGMLAAETVLVATGAPIEYWPAGLMLGAIASLLPDLDHHGSTVTVVLPFAGILSHFFKHRTVTHSIIGVLAFSLIVKLAFPLMPVALLLSIIAGYTSHLVVDMFNPMGIAILSPLMKRKHQEHHLSIDGYSSYKVPFADVVTGGFFENRVFRPILWLILIGLTLDQFARAMNFYSTSFSQFFHSINIHTMLPAILTSITVIVITSIITKPKYAWFFHILMVLSVFSIIGEWLWKIPEFHTTVLANMNPVLASVTVHYAVLVPVINTLTSMVGFVIK